MVKDNEFRIIMWLKRKMARKCKQLQPGPRNNRKPGGALEWKSEYQY